MLCKKSYVPFIFIFALTFPSLAHAALVDINTASESELETINGVGATIAGRIIDYRTANGNFTSIDQLQNISGIGSGSTYAKIAAQVTLGTSDTGAPLIQPPAPLRRKTPDQVEATRRRLQDSPSRCRGLQQGILRCPLPFQHR